MNSFRNSQKGMSRSSTRGFTIIETMIVMGIVALLGSILLLAIRGMRKTGDVTAEIGMVSALKLSVEKFKQDHGFLPPLVEDATPGPVEASGRIRIWTAQDLGNKDATLNGGPGPAGPKAYSDYSLAYYLAGALDSDYDGVKGLGFTTPSEKRDGQFSRKGKKIEALIDPTQYKTRTGAIRLFIPNATSTDQLTKVRTVIWDRWSDGSLTTGLSQPIRYYRWLPAYWAQTDPTNPGKVRYWNVPVAIGGNLDPEIAPSRAELKDAEYAIVSAGPDRLFGDEAGLADADRVKAAADNIVEVGR